MATMVEWLTVDARKFVRLIIAVILVLASVPAVEADPAVTFSYRCRLSPVDHVRQSDGATLTSIPGIRPQDILLQDRLNFHKFGIQDPEDTNEGFYSPGARAAFISIYENYRLVVPSPSLADEILWGNPWLEVEVGNGEIRVQSLGAPAHPGVLRAVSDDASPVGIERLKPWVNWNRVATCFGLLILTALISDPVRRFVLENREHPEPISHNRFLRAGVFFVVSVVLLWRARGFLEFIECSIYPWYLPMMLAVASATFVAMMPRTTLFSLVCWPIMGLMAITVLPLVLVWLVFMALAVAVFAVPFAVYAWSGWFLSRFVYENFGTTSASIYGIVWLTFFILTVRGFVRLSMQGAGNVWEAGSRISKFLHHHSPAWLVAKLLARCAESGAVWLGGNWRERNGQDGGGAAI